MMYCALSTSADSADGPNNKEGEIARALNSVGAKGTFFLNVRINSYSHSADHVMKSDYD